MTALHISDISVLLRKAEGDYYRHLSEFGIKDPVIIVNNSGGKDSGAVDMIANHIFGGDYRSVAADTGNEHPLTIEHLKNLHLQPNRGGAPVEIVSADYPEATFERRRKAVTKSWAKKQKVMAGAYRGILMPSLSNPETKFSELWRSAMHSMGLPSFETPLDAFNASCVKSGNPFLDMCLIHGGFPIGRQRYCTEELKMDVVYNQILTPLLDDGKEVIQFSGVRGDESAKRATYPEFEKDKRDPDYLFNFLPIKNWTASDVFALYRHFDMTPNPLYKQGMGRVGCMPCILVNKEELSEIGARFPEEIDRVERWEKQVQLVSRWWHWMIVGHINRRQFKQMVTKVVDGKNKRVSQSFKLGNKIRYNPEFILDTEAYHGSSMLGPRGHTVGGNIHDALDWARTGRGGQVYDLVKASLDVDVCSSKYGLCS